MSRHIQPRAKSAKRQRADAIAPFRCKHLIAVVERPSEVRNIGTIIRNLNALGVEKTDVVDPARSLPEDWQEMREHRSLSKTSISGTNQ